MHLSTCKMQLRKPYIDLICLLFCYYIEGITKVARRYEFYFRVAKPQVSKILFLPRENKIHIFKPPCNVLFIIQTKRHQ